MPVPRPARTAKARAAALTVVVAYLAALLSGCRAPDRGTTVLYGDSISWQARGYLERFYPGDHHGRQLQVKAMGGTAPCDWVGTVRADLAVRHPPRSIVLEFYGNSFTPCMGGGGRPATVGLPIGGRAFLRAYGRAMTSVRAAASRAGVTVTWLVPPVRPGSDPAPRLNATLAAMARRRHWVVSDAADALADDHGRWTRTLPCASWEGSDDGCHRGRVPVRDRSRVHFWFARSSEPATVDGYSPGAFRWAAAASHLLP